MDPITVNKLLSVADAIEMHRDESHTLAGYIPQNR